MGRTTAVAIAGGIVVLGWVLAPVIDMIRHGTCDQRTIRGWRVESQRDENATEDGDDVDIPRPREMPTDDHAEEILPGRVIAHRDR